MKKPTTKKKSDFALLADAIMHPKPPKKKAAFWDDDEPKLPPPPAVKTSPGVRKSTPAPAPERLPDPIPLRMSMVYSNPDTPFIILNSVTKDWSDLACWNVRLNCVMQMKRADLGPRAAVDEAIDFIQEHTKK